MEIGRKIYFDKATGNVIQDTGERSGDVVETTQEQDFATFKALSERVPDKVGLLQLEYGEFAQDFMECSGYRVDISGDEPALQFSYLDGTEEPEEPAFQTPLSEQVNTLKTATAEQQQTIDDLTLAIADILGT